MSCRFLGDVLKVNQDIPQKILAEPEGELRRVLGAGLSAPGRSGADLADAVGEGVEAEVGYAEEPLGGLEQVGRQDLQLDPGSEHHGGEEGHGIDQDPTSTVTFEISI